MTMMIMCRGMRFHFPPYVPLLVLRNKAHISSTVDPMSVFDPMYRTMDWRVPEQRRMSMWEFEFEDDGAMKRRASVDASGQEAQPPLTSAASAASNGSRGMTPKSSTNSSARETQATGPKVPGSNTPASPTASSAFLTR